MNIILFDQSDCKTDDIYFFGKNDERFRHCKKILKLKVGSEFKCGFINGDIGTAKILSFDESNLTFVFKALKKPLDSFPVEVILGFPRPIQLRRCLKDIATFGINFLHIVPTDLGELSYLNSNSIKPLEIKKLLLEGASQGGNTLLPKIKIYNSLNEFFTLNSFTPSDIKIIFDLNKNTKSIFSFLQTLKYNNQQKIFLAIGNERGWTESERKVFLSYNFNFCSLGNRILKTENSLTASLAIVLSVLNFWT